MTNQGTGDSKDMGDRADSLPPTRTIAQGGFDTVTLRATRSGG